MAKQVFCLKFKVLNLASIIIVGCHSFFNALLYGVSLFRGSLSCYREDFYSFGYILYIAFIDFGILNDFQDCVGEIGGLFLSLGLDC